MLVIMMVLMLFSIIEFIGLNRVVVVFDLNLFSWLLVLMKMEVMVLMCLCIVLGVFNCISVWWIIMLIVLVVFDIVSVISEI